MDDDDDDDDDDYDDSGDDSGDGDGDGDRGGVAVIIAIIRIDNHDSRPLWHYLSLFSIAILTTNPFLAHSIANLFGSSNVYILYTKLLFKDIQGKVPSSPQPPPPSKKHTPCRASHWNPCRS